MDESWVYDHMDILAAKYGFEPSFAGALWVTLYMPHMIQFEKILCFLEIWIKQEYPTREQYDMWLDKQKRLEYETRFEGKSRYEEVLRRQV
jgi:hypothetical protein